MGPREIRVAAGVSQIVAAVRTGTSEPTVRIYEADPDAVRTPAKRARLDAFYAGLEKSLRHQGRGPEAA